MTVYVPNFIQYFILRKFQHFISTITSPQLFLIALILVSLSSTDQTVIKYTGKSENDKIHKQIIDVRKEDTRRPYYYDDRNFLTYIDFNNQTKNESYLNNTGYSPTNKEKESILNGTKSVIHTVVSSEDENSVLSNGTKDASIVESVEGNDNQEENLDTQRHNARRYLKSNFNNSNFNNQVDLSGRLKNYMNDSFEKKIDQDIGIRKARKKEHAEQKDITNAVDYGLRALDDLIKVKEPFLYNLGLFLDATEPAARVANFGSPVNRKATLLSRFGYATLEASRKIAENYPRDVGRQSAGIPVEVQSRIDLDECPLRGRPRCPPASRRFRTSDGTCNNVEQPWRGSAMLPMQRFLPPVYEDGIQSIRRSVLGRPLPSPRRISTVIHRDENREIQSVTLMFMQWGQFIDHDITSTVKLRSFNGSIPRCCEGGGRRVLPPEFLHPSCLPIEVPPTDPFLSRFGIGCMEFIRSAPSTRIDCELGWREQINQVTPYIDASTIYGSDVDTSDSIRTFRNGKIFYGRPSSQEPLNPPDPPDGELCRAGALSEECLQPGDNRVSENPGLVAMHTVFVRYHNKVATVLSQINPHWSDERVFQETRKIVYSVIQHITYREFLPIVLGPEVMDLFGLRLLRNGYYDKYDLKINPTVANSFSTAAFRFGHSMIQNSFMRTDSHHIPLNNNVSLHNEIFNFENIWSFGSVDRFLLGLSNQPSQKRDEFMAEELTNHLFQFSDSTPFGMDLASINIQRGRDHGIPPYTFWRKPCGLSPINNWFDLEQVMSIGSFDRLRNLYEHVDDIDLFTAGLSEKPLKGAVVGPTFACIIAQQFLNLRKGDRFWYENEAFESSFPPAQLHQIRRVSLAQILCQTMDEIENIQPFVFLSADNFRNARASCDSPEIRNFDLMPWIEKTVEFNSISDNLDTFETERSLKALTRLGRNTLYKPTFTGNFSDKTLSHKLETKISDGDIFRHVVDKHLTDEMRTRHNKVGRQLPKDNDSRFKRDIAKTEFKNTKDSTERSVISTTKIKTNLNKKVTKIKLTTVKPNSYNTTGSVEFKYGDYNDIPKKPTFSIHSTGRPTKNKPTYYQIQDNDSNNDITYLLGLVPKRNTEPPSNPALQHNINIHYEPPPTLTTNPELLTNDQKRPNYISRLPSGVLDSYITSRPKPTQTYSQSNVVVITNRPSISTRRPLVTTSKPDVVSYPVFVYSPAYDRPVYHDMHQKKPTHTFDSMDYATTNGHKRPNTNGFAAESFDRPRPTSGYHSNGDANYDYFVKLPHSTNRPANNDYYLSNLDEQDLVNSPDKKPIYVSNYNYQNGHAPNRPAIFESQPFSTSNRPSFANLNEYSDIYTTKRPTYYFDNDSDEISITGNKKRPQTNNYHRDQNTDDILSEFFLEHGQVENTHTKLTHDSTPRTIINDKLDFKSRVIFKPVEGNDGDGFWKLSAVTMKETIEREGADATREDVSNGRSREEHRKITRSFRVLDIDVTPSEPSGQWKFPNATEDASPYMEIPELPTNMPCSYEVPKPMTEYLLDAESYNKTKTR